MEAQVYLLHLIHIFACLRSFGSLFFPCPYGHRLLKLRLANFFVELLASVKNDGMSLLSDELNHVQHLQFEA